MAMAQISAQWCKLAAAEILQRSSQTVATIGGKGYVFGGELRPREPRDSYVHSIPIAKDTPSHSDVTRVPTSSNVPQARVGSASTTLNSKFYIFSGRGGLAMKPIEEHGAFWVFDPATATWETIGPNDPAQGYPEARSYHALAADGRDTIWLHAGCPEKGRLSDLWAFRLSQRAWTKLASAPDPPRGGTSIAFAGGLLYRMNGFDGKTEQGGALDVYDPATDSWTSQAYAPDGKAGPEARSVATLLPMDIAGKPHLVTCFGERDPSNLGHEGAGKMLKDVWAFDLAAKKWAAVQTTGNEEPDARGWFAAEAVGNSALVQGGLGEANNRFGDAWLLQF